MRIILIIASVMLLWGCAATSPKSMQSDDEVFKVKLLTKDEFSKKPSELNKENKSVAVVLAAAGVVINVAAKLLENASNKFTSEYTNLANTGTFYEKPDASIFSYQGIYLSRSVKKDGKEQNAFNMKLNIVRSDDGTAFRFEPSAPNLQFSKCKVKSDSIDILVKVVVESVWVDAKGEPHKEIIGNDEFAIPKVKFIDGDPIPAMDANKGLEPPVQGHWIANVPQSSKNGRGNCTVKVTVIETDDFGKRSKAISTFLANNKDDITAIFDSLNK